MNLTWDCKAILLEVPIKKGAWSMKHHVLASTVVILIVASLLAAAACSDPGDDSSEPLDEVSCDDFATVDAGSAVVKEVTVDADTVMVVTLRSNVTTGHSWELADISDTSVLEHVTTSTSALKARASPEPRGKRRGPSGQSARARVRHLWNTVNHEKVARNVHGSSIWSRRSDSVLLADVPRS
jgi:hypothetical protein